MFGRFRAAFFCKLPIAAMQSRIAATGSRARLSPAYQLVPDATLLPTR
jgi:hypothetical protein